MTANASSSHHLGLASNHHDETMDYQQHSLQHQQQQQQPTTSAAAALAAAAAEAISGDQAYPGSALLPISKVEQPEHHRQPQPQQQQHSAYHEHQPADQAMSYLPEGDIMDLNLTKCPEHSS